MTLAPRSNWPSFPAAICRDFLPISQQKPSSAPNSLISATFAFWEFIPSETEACEAEGTPPKSPLCFHGVANAFCRNPFGSILLQTARGGTPPTAFSRTKMDRTHVAAYTATSRWRRNPRAAWPLSRHRASGQIRRRLACLSPSVTLVAGSDFDRVFCTATFVGGYSSNGGLNG